MKGALSAPSIDRAALPEILFVEDLSHVLVGLTRSAVRRALHRGELGPYVKIGRRLAIRRAALVAALESRETPAGVASPSPAGASVDRYVAMLRGKGAR